MVSVRSLHAIANKKRALIVVIDTSQSINKQTFAIDVITEANVEDARNLVRENKTY